MVAGRKREFDREEALRAAMLVFWEKGYSGASLAELTSNMGINKPSMYAAFGNKEQLHRCALELYGKHYGEKNLQILKDESKSPGLRLKNFMESVARMQFDKNLPTGCLVSSSVSETASGSLSAVTVGEVKNMQTHTENMLIEFFDSAKARGELGADFNSKGNAVLVGLLIHGSAIMARSGKSIDEVRAAFAIFLAGLGLAGLG